MQKDAWIIMRGCFCTEYIHQELADLISFLAEKTTSVFPKVRQWDRGIVDMPCSVWRINPPTGSCRLAA